MAAYDVALGQVRSQMGERDFDAQCQIGAGLDGDHAIDEAQALARSLAAGEDDPDRPPRRRKRGPQANPELTERELEVLAELVRGHTNRGIAVNLRVSPKTVMHHTVSVYRKLGVRGRAEAVARPTWRSRPGLNREKPVDPVCERRRAMFQVFCPKHGSRVLLDASRIEGLYNTTRGPAAVWRCYCGEQGTMLNVSAARSWRWQRRPTTRRSVR
jgi:DNA-binding CsgD family transcriptional regulator